MIIFFHQAWGCSKHIRKDKLFRKRFILGTSAGETCSRGCVHVWNTSRPLECDATGAGGPHRHNSGPQDGLSNDFKVFNTGGLFIETMRAISESVAALCTSFWCSAKHFVHFLFALGLCCVWEEKLYRLWWKKHTHHLLRTERESAPF